MKQTNKGHEFDKYYEQIKKIKSIFLFGAGLNGKDAYDYLHDKIEIHGFIDNDTEKQGTYFCGKNVYSPHKVMFTKDTAVVVSVAPSNINSIMSQIKKQIDNVYDMHKFIPVLAAYSYNELVFPSISYLPTTVCNLNCRCCLNFAPYIKEQEFRNIDLLKNDLGALFATVDHILLFHISGGEPFLYPHLEELLRYIAANYMNKISRLETTTNGTIVPTESLIKTISELNVSVVVDDYRQAIPKYADNFNKALTMLNKANVNYRVQKVNSWVDLNPMQKINDLTPQQATAHFENCDVPWQEYRDGKLYLCNYSAYASVAGLYDLQPDEYVCLTDHHTKKELMEFRMGYSPKGYVEFCKRCSGYGNNPNTVKPAEQMPRV